MGADGSKSDTVLVVSQGFRSFVIINIGGDEGGGVETLQGNFKRIPRINFIHFNYSGNSCNP